MATAARGRGKAKEVIVTQHSDRQAEEEVTVTHSSGNVFADLGLENPEDLLQKSRLVVAIQDAMTDRRLNQSTAAKLMNVNQPDLSKLLRGRTTSFTLDRLFGMLNALGSDVEITVVRHGSRGAERGTTSIREAVIR